MTIPLEENTLRPINGAQEWEIPLPEGFIVPVRKETLFGKWIGFAVVLVFEGQCVTRYDTAHERPHRDMLGKEKGWMGREICTITWS